MNTVKLIGWCGLAVIALWATLLTGAVEAQDAQTQGYKEALAGIQATTATAPAAAAPKSPTGSGVMYITDKIPEIPNPPVKGERYTDIVPDTYDPAARAALALHGITSCTDPRYDYEPYGWIGIPQHGVMTMKHSYHDWNGSAGKWMEALPLLRTASGSTENHDVDREMLKTFFHMLGPDGLYWIPVVGSPWSTLREANELLYANMQAKQIWNVWPAGRALLAMCAFYKRNPDPLFKDAIIRQVDGLEKLAVREGDLIDFIEKIDDGKEAPRRLSPDGQPVSPTMICGLAYAYTVTHYEKARELAEPLARFLMTRGGQFYPDGRMKNVHFHGATMSLIGILELGLATNNRQTIQFVRKAYENARTHGVTDLGWFPESLPIGHQNVETCHVADMIALAAKLSAAGEGDWWEDVECYSRNQLAVNQNTESWWLEQFAAQIPGGEPPQPPLLTSDNVAQRMLGTFNGMCGAGGPFQSVASMCCTGNGCRALYFPWRHTLDEGNGELRVNLLMNRASHWADVDSYLPYQGKVEIKMKQAERLAVRIPSWATGATCMVNGAARPAELNGRYLQVGAVYKGDKIVVEFPLRDEMHKAEIKWNNPTEGAKSVTYTYRMRGFNVVDFWPREPRTLFPAYTRSDWRQSVPRMVEVTRFAPENELDW